MQHASKQSFKVFDGSNYKVGIVVSLFNANITEKLLESAHALLATYSVASDNIDVMQVAGAIELPLVLQKLAQSSRYKCLVALGAVIRGDTTHYDYVCSMAANGVQRVMLDFNIPIGFGVLTCENVDQALARLDVGGSATEAALQSAHTIEHL